MKKLICLILLSMMILAGCDKKTESPTTETSMSEERTVRSNTDSGTNIKIYYFNIPPHIFFDEETGKLTGALHDFLEEEIAPEMGIKFSWATEYVTIPRQIALAADTPNTALALLNKTPERAAQLAFTAEPFSHARSGLAVLKTNPLNEVKTVDDISSLVIGYGEGAITTPFMRDEKIQWDLIGDPSYHSVNLERLILGRIDAVYSPGDAILVRLARMLDYDDKVKIINLPDSPAARYVVFSKKNPELVEKYNAAFTKLGGENLYLKKLAKYTDL